METIEMSEVQRTNMIVGWFLLLIKREATEWRSINNYYEEHYERLNDRWDQWIEVMSSSKHYGDFYRHWC
jgi:hypothetical protein